jgi:hypothetical protein
MAGLYSGTDLATQTFYGFRLNNATGDLNVEIINDGSAVNIPQEGAIDANDYKAWVWSRDTVRFQWSNNGHLMVKFL